MVMRERYEIEIPNAPRDKDDTDEEYEQFNEGWQYDLLGDLLATARGLGIEVRRL
jgi:hypothetical protein